MRPKDPVARERGWPQARRDPSLTWLAQGGQGVLRPFAALARGDRPFRSSRGVVGEMWRSRAMFPTSQAGREIRKIRVSYLRKESQT